MAHAWFCGIAYGVNDSSLTFCTFFGAFSPPLDILVVIRFPKQAWIPFALMLISFIVLITVVILNPAEERISPSPSSGDEEEDPPGFQTRRNSPVRFYREIESGRSSETFFCCSCVFDLRLWAARALNRPYGNTAELRGNATR